MNIKTLFSIALFGFISNATIAQTTTAAKPVSTLKNDNRRIRQGVRSGELTKSEVVKLKKEERDIRKDEKEARQDGVVTAAERKDIRSDKRKLSRDIYRKKHNEKERP